MGFWSSVLKGPGGDNRPETVGTKVKAPSYKKVKWDEDKVFRESVYASAKAVRMNKGGLVTATKAATKVNEATTASVIDSMDQMLGGKFASLRDSTTANIQSHLDGEVSVGTQRQVSRDVLRKGISELGRGAVSDSYAGYLGLTRESLATQGAQEFQSLYTTLKQGLPTVTGAQLAPLFTHNPGQFAQIRLQANMADLESDFRNAENRYKARLTAAQYAAEPDPVAAANAQQAQDFWGSITGYGASMGASFMGGGGMGG